MRLPQRLKNSPTFSQDTDGAVQKTRWRAAVDIVASMQNLQTVGKQVVQTVLDGKAFVEWDHYPDNDVRDVRHGSQYFYHAHPGLQRPFVEHGHFHLFVHAEELGLRRADPRYESAPAHVLAVSMDAQGLPTGFFVVNRWVTKGPWLSLPQCRQALSRFQIKGRNGNAEVNRFLRALLTLYQTQIEALLEQRDHIMQKLSAQRDRRSVFADRQIEVLCYHPISLMDDIAALESSF